MESPVSAFVMYSANKKQNREKKDAKKNRKSALAMASSIEDNNKIMIEIAKKLKQKQKKDKKPKNIMKTKKKSFKNKTPKIHEKESDQSNVSNTNGYFLETQPEINEGPVSLTPKNMKIKKSFKNKTPKIHEKESDQSNVSNTNGYFLETQPEINEGPVSLTPKNMKIKKSFKNKTPKIHEKESDQSNVSNTNGYFLEMQPEINEGPASLIVSNENSITDDKWSQISNASFDFTPIKSDSKEEALKMFQWLIAPQKIDYFFSKIWEKDVLHVARNKPNYYTDIITTPVIDDMLRNEDVQFTKNVDITSYVNGKRETHNPGGRAHPRIVWDYYLNGCSVRLLNPQTYIPKLHQVNATLQEFFNSFVGANAYLTPPDSQGFAPHYDDIEAFILQVEGKKHWRIYKPKSENEFLPRISSGNFDQNEIGEPILEVTLEAGDLMYFPRGYIHQAVTIDGEHSLHVTISMCQKHSWADLFEKMIPAALQIAISENVELRRGLPFNIYENFGVVHSDSESQHREKIKAKISSLFDKIKEHLPIDDAVDQMNKHYQHDALPPVLTDMEKAVTVFSDTDMMISNGKVVNRVELELDTKIRLLRKNILRMVTEENSIRLYFYVENSTEYHGNDMNYHEIDENLASAVETLIVSYPEYVSIENLDAPNDTDKLHIAETLWSHGLIMAEYPLGCIDDD